MNKILYILSLFILLACGSANAQKYNTHRVKSGETIEAIAKKYKVAVSDIYKLNPDSREKLKLNSVLIIPNTESNTSTTVSEPLDEKTVERTFLRHRNHRTKRNETLFSIAKKYDIEIEDVKKYNRFLYANNLKKGDKLKIPVYKTVVKIKTLPKVKSKNTNYVVQPKEGKWRIAYKYGITVQELEALNPNMVSVLQPGQSLIVPNLEVEKINEVDSEYSYYKVLPREGFYRLKVKLGVEQTDLERLNPELVNSGLKVGMVLKTPYNNSINNTEDGIIENNDNNEESESIELANYVSDSSIKNISVMLPFMLNKIDTDSVFDTKQIIKNDRTLGITLDFYSGVLVAFDSLKKLGVNLKVNVYDTQNRLSEVNSIIGTNDFKETHAVIGPLLPTNFNAVANALERYSVPVVSPVVKTVSLGSNVFQSRPNDDNLRIKIIDYFKADTTAQVLIITDLKRKSSSRILKSKFPNSNLVSSRLNSETKRDAYYLVDEDLINMIKPGNNIVFLETDNAGFVSNVSSILNGLQIEDKKIILTTTNKNEAFGGEEVSNYHLSNLNFTYPSISKILNSDTSNSFVKHYKQEYKIVPSTYAIRGFDVTMDVVLRLVTSQDMYQSVNDAQVTSYIENKFIYKKKLYGGYYNDGTYILQYNNLEIDEIKQ